ncbi:unnamed protein product [Gongylonema pulchrum]|uniref:Secreted protein n=1 Tax=Gongylonema pulchrum TaxID=637853 RepID=A0A183DPW7_9BILA|nr:unnamed protein product [Gongylonema pulchrum]
MKLIDAMGYAVGVCASLNGVCHPFIFAFAHRDFKEVLQRRGGLIQKISATSSHFTNGRAPTIIGNIPGNRGQLGAPSMVVCPSHLQTSVASNLNLAPLSERTKKSIFTHNLYNSS